MGEQVLWILEFLISTSFTVVVGAERPLVFANVLTLIVGLKENSPKTIVI